MSFYYVPSKELIINLDHIQSAKFEKRDPLKCELDISMPNNLIDLYGAEAETLWNRLKKSAHASEVALIKNPFVNTVIVEEEHPND